MEDKYISVKELVNTMLEEAEKLPDDLPEDEGLAITTAAQYIMEYIKRVPAVDVQPVKHGKWVKCDYKTLDHGEVQTYIGQGVYCSECKTGKHKNEVKEWVVCPYCGAKMDGNVE